MLVGGVADCTICFVDGELPLVFKQLLGLDADRSVIGLAAFESERCQPFGIRELHVWDFGAEALELVVAFPDHFLLLSVMVSSGGMADAGRNDSDSHRRNVKSNPWKHVPTVSRVHRSHPHEVWSYADGWR